MKNILLSLIFVICGRIEAYSQFPIKKIIIENSNLTSSKIEYGRLIVNEGATIEKGDYVPTDYIVIKNNGIKNNNKWLFFDNVNYYYKSIFFITITKDSQSMQLLFAFKAYDEVNPNHIFLENISFVEGTYFFDFVDRKIMSTPYGSIDERFGDFHLDLGNYKKFRVSKKLISEEELKKFIDNPILKQPKKITRILSVFEDQY